MTLPIDLVLVRHGQSEGNIAKRLSEGGDNKAIEKLRERHSGSFRLTDIGRQQAVAAGKWLTDTFYNSNNTLYSGFDRCYTSEYLRAMETAGLLKIPNAEWFCDPYLRERDWGDLDTCPEDERLERFGDSLRLREVEPFFWTPPNGESFADLRLRNDRMLFTLHRECSDKRVVLICHGEVMWVIRAQIERMPQQRFRELYLSKNLDDRIHNCQIFHYTRRNPETNELAPYINWFRSVRPAEKRPLWDTGWQTIKRPRYSSSDLLEIVATVPRTVK